MIEKEIKVLLSKEQYDILNNSLEWEKEFDQENYYYLDKNGEIREKDITVRIRKKDGGLKLQTKVSVFNKNSLKIKEEQEIEVNEIYEKIGKSLYGKLIFINADYIYKVGVLTTKRKILKFLNGNIALDRNQYLNKNDYELEIEYTGTDVPKYIFNMITNLVDIEFNIRTKGKNRRFLEEYDHQKNSLI